MNAVLSSVRFRTLLPALALALASSAVPARASAQEVPAPFTADQVEAGEEVYGRVCAACHMADFSGGTVASPLAGAYFASSWGGSPVAELLDFVEDFMPMDEPGSLDEAAYAAVVAYLLSVNGMTPGETPLARGAPGLVRPAPPGGG